MIPLFLLRYRTLQIYQDGTLLFCWVYLFQFGSFVVVISYDFARHHCALCFSNVPCAAILTYYVSCLILAHHLFILQYFILKCIDRKLVTYYLPFTGQSYVKLNVFDLPSVATTGFLLSVTELCKKGSTCLYTLPKKNWRKIFASLRVILQLFMWPVRCATLHNIHNRPLRST